MKPTELLSAQLLDILFADRNKSYGAYELRKTYSKRINTALFITLFVAAAAFGTAAVASGSEKKIAEYKMRTVIELTQIPDEKPEEPLPEPEQKPEPEPVQTRIFTTPPKIVEVVENPMPDQPSLDSVLIGTENIFDGRKTGGEVEFPKDPREGTGIVEPKQEVPDDKPLSIVEVEAKFVGDWVRFLLKNLNADVPIENNAGPGRYSVIIQFVVDKEGNVSDINALTKHGYGMEEEAIRVIKKAPRWEPAIQNGYKVKAYRKQVITFDVLE